MLANNYVNVATGNGLAGGGHAPLGGNGLTLAVDPTKIPFLNAQNTFNASQLVQGTLTAGILASTGPTQAGGDVDIAGDARVDANGRSNGNYAGIESGNVVHGIRFGVGGTGIDLFTDFTPRLSVTNSGSVGIGTTTPAALLDVAGGANVRGVLTLPAAGTATAFAAVSSQPLAFVDAGYNPAGYGSQVNQTFQWQAQVNSGNNSASPVSTLNLLYGSNGGVPTRTGLSINANGTLNFASGQKFPVTGTGGGTITGVTTASPLTGSATSGSVALGLNTAALETTLNGNYAQLTAANLFTGNQTVIGGLNVEGGAQGYTGVVSALSLTATNPKAGTNAVYGANTANSGSSNGGYFSSASPAGSAVYGANTAGGYAGYFHGKVTVTGALTANGAFQGAGFSASSATPNDSVVQGTNTAAKGTSNGGYFSSVSPAGSGVVGVNTAGGNAGYFQGAVTVTGALSANGAIQGAGFSGSNALAGASVVQGASTAATGKSNGGYFTSASPAGTGVVGVNAAGGNAGYFQGPVVVTGSTATGQLGVGGDKPMSHNPHMVFSGFVPSFGSGFGFNQVVGGYLVPDQNIVITRITASEGSPGSNCENPAIVWAWDATRQPSDAGYNATVTSLGNGITYADSGPINFAVRAGDQVQVIGVGGGGTNVLCVSPGNVFINVQYVMQ
jgi:hypothetical protein